MIPSELLRSWPAVAAGVASKLAGTDALTVVSLPRRATQVGAAEGLAGEEGLRVTMTDSTQIPTVQVARRGGGSQGDADYAREKIASVLRYTNRPVLFVRVTLTRLANPALSRPAVAQANIDVNGRLIRAQVARPTMTEAVDELHDRLREQLDRAGRDWESIRGRMASTEPHEWRHADEPTRRDDGVFPRPAEERDVVRHKSFTLARMTVDEAAFDMGMLDYDFHLFTEDGSGVDSVLSLSPDGSGYELSQVVPLPDRVTAGAVQVKVKEMSPPQLTIEEARDRLEYAGWPFVFFRDPDTDRGRVLYRRYDGHYGLIVPAE